MSYLFTSESVSEGHPDKIADQISDAILDAMLEQDPDSRVACETFVTTGLVVVGGEVTTKAYVEIPDVVRETIKRIGYTKDDFKFDAESCGVMVTLHAQSPDIAQGVDEGDDKEQGAGDQGMMFGYAINETPEYMPMALAFSHRIVKKLADIRKEATTEMSGYLRPDAKAQITIEYGDDKKPLRVHTVVVSTQHDDFIKAENGLSQKEADRQMLDKIKRDVIEYAVKQVIPAEMLDENTIYHINPTGKFVIGGPHGDAGLTGRKIIVDTYGGRGAHGGGAFSGKDSSKVDRSAAYASRHIAKNLAAAGLADEVMVQVAYAIGVAKPVSLNVNTFGTSKVNLSDEEISQRVEKLFDMRPKAIVERLGLKNPIFSHTAAYGHMGREAYEEETKITRVEIKENGSEKQQIYRTEKKKLQFFGWEKLDYVDQIKKEFNI